MDHERFALACEKVSREEHAKNGIGTLREKTLHAVLKQYMEPCEACHEVKIGAFVADIARENGVVEIQTRSFDKLRKKLAALLEVAAVTVVYPIAHTKWLIWVDPETGEAAKKRKSPKRGRFHDAFFELYRIKPLLTHPNLRIHLLLIDMEEYRALNGWSRDRKRGSSRYERIPTALAEEMILETPPDYRKLIPADLQDNFTSKDFKKLSGLSLRAAQTALNVLNHVGATRCTGKQGNLKLYRVNQPEA